MPGEIPRETLGGDAGAIVLDGVSHRYGHTAALADVSLAIPAGTATALVGPDGVGKSTLLALVAGVKRMQAGKVLVLGGDMDSSAHRDRSASRIAYMPQGLGRNLYPMLSVVENIDFFGSLFGLNAQERRVRIDRLLRATGLHPFADRPAGKLSGGMRQKLSLCCALIHDPDLLILDEPTTGVDPLSRRQFWSLIDEIRAGRPGMTVLVATAYMEEAERFDRLVVIDAGRILAAGMTADVLARAGARTLDEAFAVLQGRVREPDAPVRPEPPSGPAGNGAPAILAEGLTRRFGDFTAVDHVSFAIGRGEIFGFLGSNGCGKTTTMKMLTGLLPASEGRAELLGRPVEAGDIETRMRVGYMSQSFSLYEELSVRANLELHARLYRIPAAEIGPRVRDALDRFDLSAVADARPTSLPLGIRQRLQLAAACLHRPEVLILDEPTSGVDPAARDMFWRHLRDLARRDGVTIFVSTHFMTEAERCDRVSLMHAGRTLAVGTPTEIREARGSASLEDAFVACLIEATGDDGAPAAPVLVHDAVAADQTGLVASFGRILAFARRELKEILRDPVRIAFAFLSPLALMITFGYGVTFDVENLPFAVFDRDRSAASRQFVESFAGSRYFEQKPPIHTEDDIDRRLRSGELRVTIDIPPAFGRDLLNGDRPEVAFLLDGAMPFRAETARGYVEGIVMSYAQDAARRTVGEAVSPYPVEVEARFRYNQEFRSAVAITPGCIMILLIIIPSMLTALGVVREREMGSISNLQASPATVAEFLLGKQMPYVALGFLSFLSLTVLVDILFGVTVRGSFTALALGALLYVFAGTGVGLVVSTAVRTQVAAIIATAVLVTVPAINFSGYLYPAATIEGAGRYIGLGFPSLWFQNISIGTFAKGRPFSDFHLEFLVLFAFGVGFLAAASLLLKKQER
jgi:ribosome-dependent ATPase